MSRQQQRSGLTFKTTRSNLALGAALVLPWLPSPAWSQERGAEPQANPQFQRNINPAPGGSPISGPIESRLAPQESGSPSEVESAASASSFHIGAAPTARSVQPSGTTPMETKVSIRVKGAPLATFLETISAQSKINFIISEGLESKRVTAYLQNVSVREALQILLEIKGLTYQQIGKSNTYVISPRSKSAAPAITRIYTLSHIPLISVGGAGASGESGVEIVNVLKSVLSPPQGGQPAGQIALDRRTNAVVITDVAEVFPQVEQIIAELDKKAPQVMIETQIVEIDSNRARDLGFEWGGANGELATFSMNTRTTSFPFNLPKNLGHTHFFDPISNAVGGGGVSAAGAVAGGLPAVLVTPSILDLTQLKISLRALVSRSEARFLGKPKVLTLNNKSAMIQVTSNQAIALQSQQTSVGSSGAQNTVAPQREQTGLTLKVTPQINKEGYITMLVEPQFTDVVRSAISSAANPVFDTISRQASTLVRVKNGQTLVMGGLLKSTENKVVRKVPFLGYIPLLGWLFTHEAVQRINSDLVIFITPTIVND